MLASRIIRLTQIFSFNSGLFTFINIFNIRSYVPHSFVPFLFVYLLVFHIILFYFYSLIMKIQPRASIMLKTAIIAVKKKLNWFFTNNFKLDLKTNPKSFNCYFGIFSFEISVRQ